MSAEKELLGGIQELTGTETGRLFGRASSALALALPNLSRRFPSKTIALPSFLCHAPVAAVHAAGWNPFYCDVDPATGNVPEMEWLHAFERGCRVFLWPHLFGEPAPSGWISTLRDHSEIFVFEDAAQALGAKGPRGRLGGIGDATLVSFGHSKIIETGPCGAMVGPDGSFFRGLPRSAPNAMPLAKWRPAEDRFRARFYARRARLLQGDSDAMRGFLAPYQRMVHPRLDRRLLSAISAQLSTIPEKARRRRRIAQAYDRALRGTGAVPLSRSEGNVPWRYSFRLPTRTLRQQHAISERLRAKGLDVSNWYLPVHWMESRPVEGARLEGTRLLSRTIFQFWINGGIDAQRIRRSADAIRELHGP